MKRRPTALDTMKTFLATPMELVALSDAIHHYLDASVLGQLTNHQQQHIVPFLQTFQNRLIQQREEEQHP